MNSISIFHSFSPGLYLLFVKDLKEHLQWNHLLLTGKFDGDNETLNNEHHLLALSRQLDFIHFTPDYQIDPERKYYSLTDALKDHGILEFEYVIDKLIEIGIPPTKIVAGFSFGGIKLDTALRTHRYVGYNEICKVTSNKDWTNFFELSASLAVIKKKHEFINFWRYVIVYENTRSIVHRVRMAMKRNLAGVMVSFINTDDLRGECSNGDEKYEDFVSPHVAITLTISEENRSIPLLNTINLMMVMATYEIDREAKLSNRET